MPTFIKCYRKEGFVYGTGYKRNNPVNIDLCKAISMRYENNGFGKKNPIIEFVGCDTKWYYHEDDTKLCEQQCNDILKAFKYTEK